MVGNGAVSTPADLLGPQRRRQLACADRLDHSLLRGMPLPHAKSACLPPRLLPATCGDRHNSTLRTRQAAPRPAPPSDSHGLVCTQAPRAPLLVYDPCYSHACLIGVCTQVAPLPCYYSASVPTSSRAAQPTLARSASSCMYQCYVWKRAYAISQVLVSPRRACTCTTAAINTGRTARVLHRKLPRSSLCSAAHLHRS